MIVHKFSLIRYLHRMADEISWDVTVPLGQNGRHFADDIFKCIFMNDFDSNFTVVPTGPTDNKSALVQAMAWRRTITLNIADPIRWRIYAEPWGDELNLASPIYIPHYDGITESRLHKQGVNSRNCRLLMCAPRV